FPDRTSCLVDRWWQFPDRTRFPADRLRCLGRCCVTIGQTASQFSAGFMLFLHKLEWKSIWVCFSLFLQLTLSYHSQFHLTLCGSLLPIIDQLLPVDHLWPYCYFFFLIRHPYCLYVSSVQIYRH